MLFDNRLPKNRRNRLRVTLAWVGGLVCLAILGVSWLGGLGLAVYFLLRARGRDEVIAVVAGSAVFLFLVGSAFARFVNGFYDWWAKQRASYLVGQFDSLVNSYTQEVSLELSETLKRQLRDSTTFQASLAEAVKLVAEAVAFSAVSHASEETDAFRKAWQAKTKNFAERIADDPLAVEVVLKAIEKESEREAAARQANEHSA